MLIYDNTDNAITRALMNTWKKDKPEGKIKRKSAAALARLQIRKASKRSGSGLSLKKYIASK